MVFAFDAMCFFMGYHKGFPTYIDGYEGKNEKIVPFDMEVKPSKMKQIHRIDTKLTKKCMN